MNLRAQSFKQTLIVLAALIWQPGCRKTSDEAAPGIQRPSAPPASASAPLDRLSASELLPGEVSLFGLTLPRGMQVQGLFEERGIAFGVLRPEAVANYVRDHVESSGVEVGAARTIFPAARIKGAPPDRTYRIEVLHESGATRLFVEDITPRPPRHVAPMTDEERWRRAGFTPNGKPLNPKDLE